MIAASVHLPFAPLDLQLQEAKAIQIQWKTFLEDGTISPNEMAVLVEVDDEEKWSELLTKVREHQKHPQSLKMWSLLPLSPDSSVSTANGIPSQLCRNADRVI